MGSGARPYLGNLGHGFEYIVTAHADMAFHQYCAWVLKLEAFQGHSLARTRPACYEHNLLSIVSSQAANLKDLLCDRGIEEGDRGILGLCLYVPEKVSNLWEDPSASYAWYIPEVIACQHHVER